MINTKFYGTEVPDKQQEFEDNLRKMWGNYPEDIKYFPLNGEDQRELYHVINTTVWVFWPERYERKIVRITGREGEFEPAKSKMEEITGIKLIEIKR